MGKGREYLNWLTEEEKIRWITNFTDFGLLNTDIDRFLDTKDNWMSFVCGSFYFKNTPEGEDYWIGVYNKYKKYDNLKVKKGFNNFTKQPKIM